MLSAFYHTAVSSPELEEDIYTLELFPKSAECGVQKANQVVFTNTDFSKVSQR